MLKVFFQSTYQAAATLVAIARFTWSWTTIIIHCLFFFFFLNTTKVELFKQLISIAEFTWSCTYIHTSCFEYLQRYLKKLLFKQIKTEEIFGLWAFDISTVEVHTPCDRFLSNKHLGIHMKTIPPFSLCESSKSIFFNVLFSSESHSPI